MAAKPLSKKELLALNKTQLVELAQSLGIDTKGALKEQLLKEIEVTLTAPMSLKGIPSKLDTEKEKSIASESETAPPVVAGVGLDKTGVEKSFCFL